MQNAKYVLLLHIEGYGTISRSGNFGDSRVCANPESKIYVLVDDLLDEAFMMYPGLSNVPYHLELLVNNLLVVETEGLLQ